MLKNQLGNDPGSDSTEEARPPGAVKGFGGCGASGNLLTASLSRFFITWTALKGGRGRSAHNRLEVKLKPTSRFQCLGLQGDTRTEEVLGALTSRFLKCLGV